MHMSVLVAQFEAISKVIRTKFDNITPKQESRIFEECYSLFLFINSYKTKELDNGYKNIHNKIISNFRVDIKNKTYHSNDLIQILKEANQISIFTTGKYDSDINEIVYKETYKAGEFSKAYKIIDNKYDESYIKGVKVDISHIFANCKSVNELLEENKGNEKICNIIRNFVNFEINIIGLATFLTKYKGFTIKENKTGKYHTISRTVVLDQNKINEIILQACKINHGIYFITESAEGRIYSSFSNLNKLISPFIKEKIGFANHLVELDITNCQLLLLSFLFDSKEFKQIVENGKYYEQFVTDKLNRDQVKLLTMVILFGKSLISKRNRKKLEKIEGFADFLDSYRGLKERNEQLFHKLQSMESHIFIEIMGDFCKSNGINYFTKHDSIMIDKGFANKVEKKLKNSIFAEYGLNANIKKSTQKDLINNLIKKLKQPIV